jgi:hypothetical protein
LIFIALSKRTIAPGGPVAEEELIGAQIRTHAMAADVAAQQLTIRG